MPNCYITFSQNLHLAQGNSKIPKVSFKNYYADLYHLYNQEISSESYLSGGQYSFAEIGEQLLMLASAAHNFNQPEFIILSHWSNEFDPKYSHCGPYLQQKFNLTQNWLDICEQGSLAGITGLILLKKLISQNIIVTGMLLALEQSTQPRNLSDQNILPEGNGGCLMRLSASNITGAVSNNPNKTICQLHHAQIYTRRTSEPELKFFLFLVKILTKCLPRLENLTIAVKPNSWIWQNLTNWDNPILKLVKFNLQPLANEASLLTVLDFIHTTNDLIQSESNSKNYFLVLDQDIESDDIGILLLEPTKNVTKIMQLLA
jgi:hypothetical protein